MPGLKALTDRLPVGDTSRSVTPIHGELLCWRRALVSGRTARSRESFGWRAAFYVTGIGPIIMARGLPGPCPELNHHPAHSHLLDFAPVLRNRTALGYILGYGAHCFELYGMRTWIVAFWTFVMAQNNGMAPLGAVSVSVIVTLLVATGKRAGKRSRAALRASPRHHLVMVRRRRWHWTLALMHARHRCSCSPSCFCMGSPFLQIWGTYIGHKRQRRAGASRRHLGAALDGWLSAFRRWARGQSALCSMLRAVQQSHRRGWRCSYCLLRQYFSAPLRCCGRTQMGNNTRCDASGTTTANPRWIGVRLPEHIECDGPIIF